MKFFYVATFLVMVYLVIRTMLKAKQKNIMLPPLSNEKKKKYEQLGMTDSEIKIFRETMNVAKEQIKQLERNLNADAKLKAVNLHHDTIKVCHTFFKDIADEPLRLPEADQFLYTYLPNIVELTNKYLEISRQTIKNRQTYQTLAESAQTLDELAFLINQSYADFCNVDLKELQLEVDTAKYYIEQNKKKEEQLND